MSDLTSPEFQSMLPPGALPLGEPGTLGGPVLPGGVRVGGSGVADTLRLYGGGPVTVGGVTDTGAFGGPGPVYAPPSPAGIVAAGAAITAPTGDRGLGPVFAPLSPSRGEQPSGCGNRSPEPPDVLTGGLLFARLTGQLFSGAQGLEFLNSTLVSHAQQAGVREIVAGIHDELTNTHISGFEEFLSAVLRGVSSVGMPGECGVEWRTRQACEQFTCKGKCLGPYKYVMHNGVRGSYCPCVEIPWYVYAIVIALIVAAVALSLTGGGASSWPAILAAIRAILARFGGRMALAPAFGP